MVNDDEVFHFRTCRSLDGSLHSVDTCRRNGRHSAVFSADWISHVPVDSPDETDKHALVNGLFENLNALEIYTWHSILNGFSISEIAMDEGVSRQAIYSRIQGKHQKGGGMISRNVWVWLWWTLRQQERDYE